MFIVSICFHDHHLSTHHHHHHDCCIAVRPRCSCGWFKSGDGIRGVSLGKWLWGAYSV